MNCKPEVQMEKVSPDPNGEVLKKLNIFIYYIILETIDVDVCSRHPLARCAI
jgi:hypothetical protein